MPSTSANSQQQTYSYHCVEALPSQRFGEFSYLKNITNFQVQTNRWTWTSYSANFMIITADLFRAKNKRLDALTKIVRPIFLKY